MITLLDTKNDEGILAVSGGCSNSSRFNYLINAATRQLMRRGDWVGTITPIHVCVRNGCLVFPRYVGSIRKLNLCSRRPNNGSMQAVPLKNEWFEFIEPRAFRHGFSGMGEQPVMFSEGRAPAYSDIYGDGRLVRAYPRCQADIGKTITIFGVDNGNQPLRTNNGDGTWSDGVTITLADPFGSTSLFVRRIDRVVKDVTQCQVFLYAYNASADVLEDLAIYDPGETSPDYQRYKLQSQQGRSCCGNANSVVALVKLQYIPAKFDTDLVIIDNLDALKLEIQSIRAGEAGDRELMKQFQADAVAECNRALEDAFPDDTVPISNEVFGPGVTFGQQCF